LLLLFTVAITVLLVVTKYTDEYSYVDAAILVFLSIFIYMGHKWAMLLAMADWTFGTFEKVYLLLQVVVDNSSSAAYRNSGGGVGGGIFMSVLWWVVIMHQLYLAFIVEKRRSNRARLAGGLRN
jgi:hypothetical protein